MEPFQAWFHAHSPLALGADAPHRIVEKARGIGATLMTAMDLLLLAHTLGRVKIPVAGRQSDTGDEFIDKTHDLLEDCAIPGFFDPDPSVRKYIRLGNKSELRPIPGGSPDSIRSMRGPAFALDEFAFHPHPGRIIRASRGIINEGGQATILSTHDGADTKFFEIVDDARAGKNEYMLFSFPLHDPKNWSPRESIASQVESGRLRLLAPWVNIAEIDKFRIDDLPGYEQEYLAQIIDTHRNLLPRDVVRSVVSPERVDWEVPYPITAAESAETEDEAKWHVHLAESGVRVPVRPEGNINPVCVGVDFASQVDLAAFVAFETLPNGRHVQRWCAVLHRYDTPHQVTLLKTIVRTLRPVLLGIDMTGGGTGLFEYAVHIPGTSTVPFHFSMKADMPDAVARVPIKKALALTLSGLVQRQHVTLVDEDHPLHDKQVRHLTSLRRADLDAPRKEGEGHGDLFWADAIALYLAETSTPTPGPDLGNLI